MVLSVIGAQWGDEGKGKIVDFLSGDADVVVRFSGGANAGHTIVHDGVTYKLHLVPSGVVYPNATVILGTGMVIDPEALRAELMELGQNGVHWQDRVLVSNRAHIVLPRYRAEDVERDKRRKEPIGTTGRGIGIAYSHKALRDGVRVADLPYVDGMDDLTDEDRDFLKMHRDLLLEMAVDITSYLAEERDHRVLLEGAQGVLLDLDLGTYPYVSSGTSAAAGAALGAGIGPGRIDHVLGVFKAYSTRVGNGPFPTEFDPERDAELDRFVRDTGREYGVTTGRPRRCGYLDLVALRYACRANGIDSLALTHLDVYDELDEIKACVGYETEEETLEEFPASARAMEKVTPVLKRFPGWKKNIGDARNHDDLPQPAREYVAFIEQYVGVPVSIISVGYERSQTIVRHAPWTR